MIVVFLLRYKKKRKDLRATTLSVKFTLRREVRVAYILAICNRRFYSLLGSGKDYEVCHRYEAKQPFLHVAPNLGCVKLCYEFSDLLCTNARL